LSQAERTVSRMGVLFDYFRAPDAASVAKLMQVTDGGSPIHHGHEPAADSVDAKGIEPHVTLGQLVQRILGLGDDADVIGGELVWPAGAESADDYQGPWVVVLDDQARDALAGIEVAQMPELATWWSGIEEIYGGGEVIEPLMGVLTELRGLAHRAQTAGDHLYCWICL
jgi:hypothetical protein